MELSKTTHFFLHANDTLVHLLRPIEQLNCESIDWVVGSGSLTKTDVIKLLNKIQKLDAIH